MAELSPCKFPWLALPSSGRMISFGTLHSMDAEAAKAERHGQAFRAFRVECGLSLGDVARGWEISTVEVSELERGLHRFPDATALWNALQQLWFWKAEKHHG